LAIGPAGRTVQCVRCSHRWFERIKVAPASPIASPPHERPVPDFVIRPQSHYTSGLPALTQPRPAVHWGRWLTAAATLAVVLGIAAVAYRDEIRDRLPPEWRAILSVKTAGSLFASPATATPPAAPQPAQLEVDLATSKVELVDGRYVVRGELVNSGRAAGSTSTLKLLFRKGDAVLGERAYPLVEGPLAPGARLGFSQTLDDPPDGTTNIVPTVE
jgi:hypothetical protein